jgi:ubiquinone/menaquinone biosynthesis C-methylase UbiE
MRSFRQGYYNVFSKFYDKFVALHSADKQGALRHFFSETVPVEEGGVLLDVCTGTGSLLRHLRKRVGPRGFVAGVDFSQGMLQVARARTEVHHNIALVTSDVGFLPFDEETFDAVTCTHAFYELKGKTQDYALREICRVLKPGRPFLMMEHDVPNRLFIRALFYVRLFFMGAKRAIAVLRHERETLERYFRVVEKIPTPTGRSKIVLCWT